MGRPMVSVADLVARGLANAAVVVGSRPLVTEDEHGNAKK
jgi:hypothetical protein